MNEILSCLARSCDIAGPGAARKSVAAPLASAAVTAASRLSQRFSVTEKNVLVAACAVMFFRYTAAPRLVFCEAAEEEGTQSRRRRSLDITAAHRFGDLLNRLEAGASGPADVPAPCISYAASAETFADRPLSDAGDGEDELRIEFLSSPEAIHVRVAFREDRLADVVAVRFPDHLACLLESLAARPDLEIGGHACMPAAELKQILEQGRGPERAYDLAPVTELITRRAERSPQALALEDGVSQLTYGQLMDLSEQVARGLLARGLAPRSRVGVLMDRSAHWVAATLGIMRADMVYVPLSTRNPPARNAYVLADSSVPLVVSDAAHRGTLDVSARTIVELPDILALAQAHVAPLPVPSCDDDAYVLYTSGSTGAPKGVRITHAALCNYVLAAKEAFGLDLESPKVLQFAEASFDASMLELFYGLCHGAATFVYSRSEILSTAEFAGVLQARGINIISPPTAFWHEWMDQIAAGRSWMPDCVKVAVIGGEAAIPDKFCKANLPPDFRLFNAYGPTECTVDATSHPCDAAVRGARHVPIGRPLPNVQVYVLDERLTPVAAGVVGEICIGGAGVSPGYVGRDDLGALRFATINLTGAGPGERIYRTGDLGYFAQDGSLTCLGRQDSQVKILGMRADLSEIETHLNTCDAIGRAIVVWDPAAPAGEGLGMYVQLAEGFPQTDETRRIVAEHLSRRLPAYMVPRRLAFVAGFALNASGKIDRARLPPIAVSRSSDEDVRRPDDPLERALWELWSRVVPRELLGSVDDDLFDRQVSSLKLGLFFAEIAVSWDVDFDLDAFADARSISAIACRLRALLQPARVPEPG